MRRKVPEVAAAERAERRPLKSVAAAAGFVMSRICSSSRSRQLAAAGAGLLGDDRRWPSRKAPARSPVFVIVTSPVTTSPGRIADAPRIAEPSRELDCVNAPAAAAVCARRGALERERQVPVTASAAAAHAASGERAAMTRGARSLRLVNGVPHVEPELVVQGAARRRGADVHPDDRPVDARGGVQRRASGSCSSCTPRRSRRTGSPRCRRSRGRSRPGGRRSSKQAVVGGGRRAEGVDELRGGDGRRRREVGRERDLQVARGVERRRPVVARSGSAVASAVAIGQGVVAGVVSAASV